MGTTDAWMAVRLAVAERAQGRGYATQLARFVAEHVREPVLGTIEADNTRSLATARSVGAANLGTLEANVITKRPAYQTRVRRGHLDDVPTALRGLLPQVDAEEVWSHRTSGTLLLQHTWNVTTLGGPLGTAVLPLIRRAGVDPSRFRFLSAHGCWGRPGELQSILSHAMAVTNSDAAIVVATVGSERQRLHRGLRRGMVGRLAGRSLWRVMGTPRTRWSLFEPICAR